MKYTKTLPDNVARQPVYWLLLSLLLLLSVHVSWASDPVVVPRFAEAFPRADDFRVTAGGKELPVLEGTIAAMTYAIINAETTVTVERATPFEEVIIRPLSANIVPKVDGNKVIFTLPHALNLSLSSMAIRSGHCTSLPAPNGPTSPARMIPKCIITRQARFTK